MIFSNRVPLVNDPSESTELSAAEPRRFERMKSDLLTWSKSVDASFAGQDYPEKEVTPADPEPTFWYDTEAYRPFLPQWKDRWEFKSYLQRGDRKRKR